MLNHKTLKSVFLTFLFLSANSASSATLENCNLVSNGLNARMPKKIDAETSAKSTFCAQSRNKKPVLHYIMTTKRNQFDISSMTAYQKNFWCTDPELKRLLSFFDIQYEYRNISGALIGSTDLISIAMCK
jgi:hypothetical protein